MSIAKQAIVASVIFLVSALAACQAPPSARSGDAGSGAVAAGLSGTVTSSNGPEAGVWVIAATTDLPLDPTKDRRVAPGADPTHTALTEIYQPPFPGYGARGGDIDRNGVFWASLSSGHLARFDRRRCEGPLNGPTAASGRHCPEGWTLHVLPGPQFPDVSDPGSAEASYYTWVDQFDTFGLGRNVPIATGNMNSSLIALVESKFVQLVVPYPMGYFTK